MTSEEMIQHIIHEVIPAMQIDLAIGRHELQDGSYYNVDEYVSKLPEDCPFESHRRFIDIQYLVKGEEMIYISDIDKLTPSVPYNREKDVTFYYDNECNHQMHLRAGDYCIFYPQNGHKASVRIGDKGCYIKKVVFKIRITE